MTNPWWRRWFVALALGFLLGLLIGFAALIHRDAKTVRPVTAKYADTLLSLLYVPNAGEPGDVVRPDTLRLPRYLLLSDSLTCPVDAALYDTTAVGQPVVCRWSR